jgi:hypothetical protein
MSMVFMVLNTGTKIKIGARGAHLAHKSKKFAALLDTDTGLMAAINVMPNPMTEDEALAAIAALNESKHAGFSDWRLPTLKELFGSVDYSRFSPAANPEFYPDVKSGWYRTSTPVAGSSGLVWVVGFNYGGVYDGNRDGRCWCRAVRSVSPASQ